MSKKVDKSGNTLEFLLIIFVVLKLTHNIPWSWWWVLSPLWIPFAVMGVVFGIGALWMRG